MKKIKLIIISFLLSPLLSYAGDFYVGYDAGYMGYGEDDAKGKVLNNVKLGYLQKTENPLRFGTEFTYLFAPNSEVTKYRYVPWTGMRAADYTTDKYSYYGFTLLGVADYHFTKKWHAAVSGGMAYDHTEYQYGTRSETFYKQTEGLLSPIMGLGIYYDVTKNFDIGFTYKHVLSDNYNIDKNYGTVGFKYHFDKKKVVN